MDYVTRLLLRLAFAQARHRLIEPPLPRFCRLGILNREDKPPFIRVGEPIPKLLRSGMLLQLRSQISRHFHFTRLGIQRKL